MAVAYLTEYATIATNANGVIQIPKEPETLTQTLVIGANVQSAVFQASTKMVRINVDAACSILFGTNPTATTTNRRMSPNQTEFVDVSSLPLLRAAVIANT